MKKLSRRDIFKTSAAFGGLVIVGSAYKAFAQVTQPIAPGNSPVYKPPVVPQYQPPVQQPLAPGSSPLGTSSIPTPGNTPTTSATPGPQTGIFTPGPNPNANPGPTLPTPGFYAPGYPQTGFFQAPGYFQPNYSTGSATPNFYQPFYY